MVDTRQDTLNVLMMGGRRAGKTSVIAGLVDTFIHHGAVRCIIEAEDKTEGDGQLSNKIDELKSFLSKNKGSVVMADESSTNAFRHYQVQLTLPDTGHSMNICFTDVNGEYYEEGKQDSTTKESYASQIDKLVQNGQVFIIAIDTPYLMESANAANHLCTNAINNSYNRVDSIQRFLTNIDDNDGKNAKMVLFVPIKCEWWMKHGKADEVVRRVEQVYDTHITNLKAYRNMEIDIIPVQTVGSIEYAEQLEAKLYQGKRCSLADARTLRFGDGSVLKTFNRDKVLPDPNAVIPPSKTLLQPNTWFKITSDKYEPHNCEQLALHLLRFLMRKYISMQNMRGSGFWEEYRSRARHSIRLIAVLVKRSAQRRSLYNPVAELLINKMLNVMQSFFGDMSSDEMEELIDRMEQWGIIKDSGEGIKRVKQCKFS